MADDKAERLAAALRANLRKRKAQARAAAPDPDRHMDAPEIAGQRERDPAAD